ncbi:MAG: epoxyqueuosine reductase QueH [Deltaproteobacteria bacterium]|jgi:predicted adenine nucleotide alpha hydrolase (AANH) superfamily ATPase|nr:epoxyqueuosine reductase QueH [Deltaproteobacteria bacterium]MBW2504478.1 epoxyqueuosine reductase QueH [Deltaproteobacteria bacterium]MBW2519737.1 epoxyqueuosine reductase QueH [Deltaproteobacteria bacterium]
MNVLLHICCANCAIFPVKTLRAAGHHITGFFFNHNIHPYQEYQKRLNAVRHFANVSELKVTYNDTYSLEEFLAAVAESPDSRCIYCYQSRLKETAAFAAKAGYEAFSSSLLYSRYQNHQLIKELAQELADHYGLKFVYHDFRVGWQEGIQSSKSMGLYRQQYCGCIYSEKDRYDKGRVANGT